MEDGNEGVTSQKKGKRATYEEEGRSERKGAEEKKNKKMIRKRHETLSREDRRRNKPRHSYKLNTVARIAHGISESFPFFVIFSYSMETS